MAMNVQPIATASERINEIRGLTAEIVNKEILPNENLLWASRGRTRRSPTRTWRRPRSCASTCGQGAPGRACGRRTCPTEYGGAGLDFLELAYMNEVLAYAIGAASLFGVVAPNSGNQSLLVQVRDRGAEAEVAGPAHRGEARVRASR